MIAQATRDDCERERKARAAAGGARRRRRRSDERSAALRREEETRKRAAEAIKAMQAEKEAQLAEKMKRKHSLQKRCGGGFVVNFKPPQVDYVGESEEVEVAAPASERTSSSCQAVPAAPPGLAARCLSPSTT